MLQPQNYRPPYPWNLAAAASSLHALTRCLLVHLPRGAQVQEVVCSLVQGKLCYGSLLLPHCLIEEEPSCQLMQMVQAQINDIARQLLGASRLDRIPDH